MRAVKPGSREEMETLVDRLIDERMMSGELDESQLTFADLRTVRSVFLQVLQGVHHPRIVYPEPAKPEAPAQDASPVNNGEEGSRNGDRLLPGDRPLPGGIEEPAMRRPPESMNMAAEG